MTEIYPVTELQTTNVSGDVTFLQNNDTTDFYSPDDADSDWNARWDMSDPGADLDGEQTVEFYLEGYNGNDAEFIGELYENGTFIETIDASTIAEGANTFTGTFADTVDPAGVEIRVEVQRGGGKAGTRANADLGYITWQASLDVSVDVTTLQPTGVTTSEATLNGEIDWEGDTVDVWFDYRQVGETTWNQTPVQTFTTTGTIQFDETLTNLSEDTEYEFRAQADGAETDTGSTVSFWTDPEAPASPTNLTGEFV